MMKIRAFIRFENPNTDELEEMDDKFPEVDYQPTDKFVRFQGSPERLQEVIRHAEAKALKPILK